jgi:hypothetical protein
MGVSSSDLAPELRSTVFQNYVIFFRYVEDRLEIINILEGHRDIPENFFCGRAGIADFLFMTIGSGASCVPARAIGYTIHS